MKAAPGAQLPVQDIFGRDKFIAEFWRDLEGNSIRMEAERRLGKTSILRKMTAQPPQDWELLYFDLEKIHSAAEFAEEVCERVNERLVVWKKQGRRLLGFLGRIEQIGPVKFPPRQDRPEGYWKKLLVSTIEDLVEQQAAVGKRVVFFFDELPWMLSAIADPEREGEQTAMEVLDVLRSLRQSATTGQGFRMVLCGSVGLHHVLNTLRTRGYFNEPVNDMTLVELPVFDAPTATELVTRLLTGEGLSFEPTVPQLIAEQTGGFPFYIHSVVADLRRAAKPVTPSGVETAIRKLITSPHDPCHFRHYKERIPTYYPDDTEVVFAVLDFAARNGGPHAEATLLEAARVAGGTDDQHLCRLLDLLARDHYLDRDTDYRYSFRHTLVGRWWVVDRSSPTSPNAKGG